MGWKSWGGKVGGSLFSHHWHNVVQNLDHMVLRKMAGAFNRLKMKYQRKLMSQPKRSQDTSDSIRHDFDTEKGKSKIVVTAY